MYSRGPSPWNASRRAITPIIADAGGRWPPSWTWMILVATVTIGAGAAGYYAWHDLTLSHYDARAHLVVARRSRGQLDAGLATVRRGVASSTARAERAVHVDRLELPDRCSPPLSSPCSRCRSGLAAITRFVHARTGSRAAALSVPAIVLTNPNVLYLQSTPMTEPLLVGLSLLAVAVVDAWLRTSFRGAPPHRRRDIGGAGHDAIRGLVHCCGASRCRVPVARRDSWLAVLHLAAYPGLTIGVFPVSRTGRRRACGS